MSFVTLVLIKVLQIYVTTTRRLLSAIHRRRTKFLAIIESLHFRGGFCKIYEWHSI